MAPRWHVVTIAIVAVAACGIAGAGCGAASPAPPATSDSLEPHWQDVFDGAPELFVVLRPERLRRDPMYGQLLNRAIDAARAQSPVVAATRALDAIDDADEIVVGLQGEDVVAVALGVRADVDPAKLVDSGGRPLWTPGEGAGRVRELVRTPEPRSGEGANRTTQFGMSEGGDRASLFELPGRTWVIASGEARMRARQVFAHPLNRPMLDRGGDALAMIRIDGRSLVRRVPQLATGGLAAAGRHLQSVVVTLQPGEDHSLLATLFFADEDAAGVAAITLREAAAALGRTRGAENLAWLGAAQVEQKGTHVVIRAPFPSELIRAFQRSVSGEGPRNPN
jgi:hypothetical protein